MTAPAEWDVIVIGAGQAGYPLAARFAEAGKRVLLAERKHVGGTCVNYGCTPTKTMVASARAAHVARTSARLGVHTGDVRVDLAAVVERKERLVLQWRDSVVKRLARAGERVSVVIGHARFVGERTVELNGQRHRGAAVVIDVGARPAVPPMPGLGDVQWLDNASVMQVTETPHHLIVLGGGYVGCEFAQMFRRFGARVTIASQSTHLLAHEDVEISEAVEEAFRAEDITLLLGAPARAVRAQDGGVSLELADGYSIAGSHLLVATGRTPNTDDLDCATAGVDLDDAGFITVDDAFRTSAEGVYAVGDVTGGPQFTHTAWDDHRLLYDLILERRSHSRAARLIPYTVFIDPQVAGVGVTERAAKERGIAYELATLPFGNIARAIETDETAGLIRILLDPVSERLLGATIVGAEAGELIHVLLAIMAADASPRALVDAQFVHPAFAEGLQTALMRFNRFKLT